MDGDAGTGAPLPVLLVLPPALLALPELAEEEGGCAGELLESVGVVVRAFGATSGAVVLVVVLVDETPLPAEPGSRVLFALLVELAPVLLPELMELLPVPPAPLGKLFWGVLLAEELGEPELEPELEELGDPDPDPDPDPEELEFDEPDAALLELPLVDPDVPELEDFCVDVLLLAVVVKNEGKKLTF